MFAIDHAATALLIKRRFPEQPIVPLLISVQLMELVWVVLNLLGVEQTTTEARVHDVTDIHLAAMPWSHSVATMLGGALVTWLIVRYGFRRPLLALAMAIGVVSHLVLDLLTHAPDIVIAPGMESPKLGLGLYGAHPMGAFALELLFGVLCWWVYRGGKALLAAIVLFNVGNLSLFSAVVPGPEAFLAGRPVWIVVVIFVQIVATLALVGYLSVHPRPAYLLEPR